MINPRKFGDVPAQALEVMIHQICMNIGYVFVYSSTAVYCVQALPGQDVTLHYNYARKGH